ncbi:tRNA 2-selenouridine(34) synthase MnmH [Balneatrix alpica]|uniref:tRNA 2-selenouridine synthase n=1 Tax=Balneatrix alpica TaxID=75684 RepID=A0ABV5ZC11_9GAMM|nr:tRNA 2-selenouridine(34) synthase MnmH [Balneatrix alpica]
MSLPTPVTDYAALFLQDIPLLDVRAPVEFAEGAFPLATNLPLLDDHQRQVIGTEYKQQGQDAAVALGYQLATPEVKQARQQAWLDYGRQHPDTVLYCFRGGMRSHISQEWMAEAGLRIPLVKGGYKALRRFLLDTLEQRSQQQPLWCLSGRTGTGKTDVLLSLPHQLDLEGLAHHRGSTFGYTVKPQPSQISFENALAIGLLKHAHHAPQHTLVVEDESRLIGRIALPPCWQEAQQRAPLLVLEASVEERQERVVRDYILRQYQDYQEVYGGEAPQRFRDYVLGNLDRIRRRLGGARHQALRTEWSEALDAFLSHGDYQGFLPGIRELLVNYYDPMYDYQLSQRQEQIACRGEAEQIRAWVAKHQPH